MTAFLLRREGSEGLAAHKEDNEDLSDESIRVVANLTQVADRIIRNQ